MATWTKKSQMAVHPMAHPIAYGANADRHLPPLVLFDW
jgi:hypothetical protein